LCKNEVVFFGMGGVAGEAGLVLRLIDWLAVDESPESHPPVEAYLFESLTMN
jgi:hypothetical protein